jgi:hypothetical protein
MDNRTSLDQIKKDLLIGERFSSMIGIKPVASASLFNYLFCLELAKLEESQGIISGLECSEVDKNKIRACRWDLLTADLLVNVMNATFNETSVNKLKRSLTEKNKSVYLKDYSEVGLALLSINDIINHYPADDIPALLREVMENYRFSSPRIPQG